MGESETLLGGRECFPPLSCRLAIHDLWAKGRSRPSLFQFINSLEHNSIALLKSQQIFQQSFYSSVGHPVVLETLLKTLLKTNKAIELRPWLPSEMIRSGNNNELILQLLVKGRGVFFRARSIGTGNCVQLTNNTRKGQRCRSNTRDKDEAAGRSCNTRM